MRWPEALDAFEASLEAQRRALPGPLPGVVPVLGVRDLGPLPAELRPRAEELLDQCRALEADVEQAKLAVATTLASMSRHRAGRPAACYLDTAL